MMNRHARKRNDRGYTLIEVLVGMVIFAVGMLALSQLQGTLARNSTDSNARTVAVNLAEEIIEQARMFSQITADGTHVAYEDIQTRDAYVEERGGNQYTVQTVVTPYYVQPDGSVSQVAPIGAAHSDMKLVELTVTWNDDENTIESQMGSGSIVLRDVISSITSPSGGKVALGTTAVEAYAPPVDYNPGANPDIISIQLGENKFKESTTPLPDVIRADELVETRFDVVTYSQSDTGATFLRREEFRAVSCECTLRIPRADSEGGLRPTIWNGNDYTEGEFVSKPYGESANNQQSEFCDLCCRDHHDGGTGVNDDGGDPGKSLYSPFRSSAGYYNSDYPSLEGDHKHYKRNNLGGLSLATSDGDVYVEACRMVRKDGFWRIAQDLRQEGLNAFPANFLDQESEVDIYSDYVTDAVELYETAMGRTAQYEIEPPSLTRPANMVPSLVFPASTPATATQMSYTGVSSQQLRSRGIYIDYMSDELRQRINCLQDGYSGSSCGVPGVTTALEVIPFYDVQLTWLSRWTETPTNFPIDVTNEAIADDNLHSRGIATLEGGIAYTVINSAVHNSNLGLTGTDPIDPSYNYDVEAYNLHARAVDPNAPPGMTTVTISGTITSSVGGVKAADVEISFDEAQCDRTNTGYKCVIETGAKFPRLKIYNYFKQGKDLYGCSSVLSTHGTEHSGDTPAQNWTIFNLPKNADNSLANIVIKEGAC